jgi:hypothetical protein
MAKKYAEYAYEEIFDKEILGEETQEDKIEHLRISGKHFGYFLKTIVSGEYVESEIYPYYFKKKDMPRSDKEKPSRKAQKNLNNKNSLKKFLRMVHTNFTKGDLILTLTYADYYFPDEEQARKDMQNYINRLKRYRKKNGLPELKYLYVISFVTEDERGSTKKVRIHHHMIINQMDRDVAEELWGKGRAEAKRLQPDTYGFEGIVRYMFGQGRGFRKWVASRNLDKPEVHRSFTRLTNRKAEQLYMTEAYREETFEKLYKGKYKYIDCKPYESDFTGGFYLYTRMVKRE